MSSVAVPARTEAEAPAAAGRPSRMSRRGRERLAAWLFLAPDLLGLTIFVGIPMVACLVLGFFQVDGFGGYRFIGLGNYQRMFADPLFRSSLGTTLLYLVVLIPGLFVVSLLLALLIRERFPAVGLFRSALFAPNVVSLIIVGLVWKFMLTDTTGLMSRLFGFFGVNPPSWLGDPHFALWSVLAVTIWFAMGYYMLIFLAGLQDIPREYYEVARIDGAGPWDTFRNITWPLLKPTSFFILLTSTVSMMTGGIDLLYVMTQGGPANSTSLIIYYIYQQAFVYGDYGYASAIGAFIVVILLIWSAGLFALTRGGRFSHVDD
ncbi:MAG: sugar ABC transporter permease [Actinocatenispora sp.]